MPRMTNAMLEEVNKRLLRIVTRKNDEIWFLKEELKVAKAILSRDLINSMVGKGGGKTCQG